jgi:hypothetical protein
LSTTNHPVDAKSHCAVLGKDEQFDAGDTAMKKSPKPKQKCPFSVACSYDPFTKLPSMVGIDREQAQRMSLSYEQKVLLCTECATIYRWIDPHTARRYGHYDERLPPREFVPLPDGPEDEFFD